MPSSAYIQPIISRLSAKSGSLLPPPPPVDMDVLYEWSLGEHPPEAAGEGDGGAEGGPPAAVRRPVPVGLAAVVGRRRGVEAQAVCGREREG